MNEMRVVKTLPIQLLGPRSTWRGIDGAAGVSVFVHLPKSRKNRTEGTRWSVLGAAGKLQLSSVCSEPKHLIVKHSLSKVGCVQPFFLDSLFVYPRLALPSHASPEFWSC